MWRWLHHHPRMQQLKEPRSVLPTFTESQVKLLLAWKPKSKYQRRLHLLILFLLDTGARISEALTLRTSEVDFDNLLITLDGKGRKQRIVPISPVLRRAMYRYCANTERKPESLLFASRTETIWNRRNILRDVKALCGTLGFTPPSTNAPCVQTYVRSELSPASRVCIPLAEVTRAFVVGNDPALCQSCDSRPPSRS